MRVVLDINILLISLPLRSRYRPIFDALKSGRYELFISNEILFEYHEKLGENTSPLVADNVIKLLLSLDNVTLQHVTYRWGLIQSDPDDNKYADCALVSNVDFLVSEDNHFKIFSAIKFPTLRVIRIDEFLSFFN